MVCFNSSTVELPGIIIIALVTLSYYISKSKRCLKLCPAYVPNSHGLSTSSTSSMLKNLTNLLSSAALSFSSMFSAETLLLGEMGRLGGVTATGSAKITSYARPPFDFSWHLISVAATQSSNLSHLYAHSTSHKNKRHTLSVCCSAVLNKLLQFKHPTFNPKNGNKVN